MINVKEYFDNLKNVSESRKLFPVTEKCIYLDSAHYGPYSLETNRRLKEFIDDFTYTNKNLSLFMMKQSDKLREKAGKLIGADKDEMIITSNATHGINIIANGLKLNKGDVVTFADCEFPAVAYPWLNQEKLTGIKVVKIPSVKGMIRIEDIEYAIKKNSAKVLTISSVEFLGFKNDLTEIQKICKANNCYLVVDAIQNTGVCPIDVKNPELDFLCAGSQKWMLAPAGIGFAYISNSFREKVNPSYASTTNINFDFKNFLKYNLDFKNDGSAYENSTLNCLGMIGLEASIDLFLKLGTENIFNHILKLLDIFIQEINNSDFIIESSLNPVNRSNILIFSHKDSSQNDKVQKYLEEKNIFIALREGFLRISPHIFNNVEDILCLVREMRKYCN